jgi:cyclohexadieny/prephenate dehydrogenase
MAIFDTVLIVGGGLIGSSIARAAREYGAAKSVLIADKSASVCAAVSRLGIACRAEQNAAHLAGEADLVILCVPPAQMGPAAAQLVPAMKDGAILSDVGSVKAQIISAVTAELRDGIVFVPAHPIAGTEYSGPEAGFATLFQDRWCILTPEDESSAPAARVAKFWETLGSNIAFMSPQRHDIVLATTSHVPHLIAYTLVGTAVDMEAVTQNEVVKFSAGGFRDFTRIAASDPVMWRDVFLENRDSVLEVVDRFIEDLSAIKRAIRWNEDQVLLERFTKTRDIRKRIIDAGQDSPAPDFGRGDPD